MELAEIRKLIIENKIDKAFVSLLLVNNNEFRDDISVLCAQYKEWERKNMLNLGVPIEERNRIIYSTLTVVNNIEKKSKSGPEIKLLEQMTVVESELAKAYEKLSGSLNGNTPVNLFITWFMQNHPTLFQKVLDEEKENGKLLNFANILSGLDLNDFLKQSKLPVTPEYFYNYILKKNNQTTSFFSGWLQFNSYRTDLLTEIERYKLRYDGLLKLGAGAVAGIAAYAIFERTIDKIIESHESGSIGADNDPTDNENIKVDNDDDDDNN